VVYVSIFSSMLSIICPDIAIIWQVWMHSTIIFFMVQFSFYCSHLPCSCIDMCATCSVGNIHWFCSKICKILPILQYAYLCVSWDSTISLGGHPFWGHQALQCLQILRLLNNNNLEMYTKQLKKCIHKVFLKTRVYNTAWLQLGGRGYISLTRRDRKRSRV